MAYPARERRGRGSYAIMLEEPKTLPRVLRKDVEQKGTAGGPRHLYALVGV